MKTLDFNFLREQLENLNNLIDIYSIQIRSKNLQTDLEQQIIFIIQNFNQIIYSTSSNLNEEMNSIVNDFFNLRKKFQNLQKSIGHFSNVSQDPSNNINLNMIPEKPVVDTDDQISEEQRAFYNVGLMRKLATDINENILNQKDMIDDLIPLVKQDENELNHLKPKIQEAENDIFLTFLLMIIATLLFVVYWIKTENK